jgi:hypothetical protein
MNSEGVVAKIDEEVRDARGEVQNTRFHQNTNEELESPWGATVSAVTASQSLPDPPHQET